MTSRAVRTEHGATLMPGPVQLLFGGGAIRYDFRLSQAVGTNNLRRRGSKMKPILILNIAWMRDYRGVTGDTPLGTFRYMREGGTPHEALNFLPTRGRCYGYAAVRDGTSTSSGWAHDRMLTSLMTS